MRRRKSLHFVLSQLAELIKNSNEEELSAFVDGRSELRLVSKKRSASRNKPREKNASALASTESLDEIARKLLALESRELGVKLVSDAALTKTELDQFGSFVGCSCLKGRQHIPGSRTK